MTKRVLIVDDEKNIRVTLGAILTEEGYDVTEAHCGERAVKICGKHNFDIILMDARMPGIDGVEAFKKILTRRPDVRVIMMSAYSMAETQREALDAGAIAFLRKPLDVEQLLILME